MTDVEAFSKWIGCTLVVGVGSIGVGFGLAGCAVLVDCSSSLKMHRFVVELDADGDGAHSQGDLNVYCVDDNTEIRFDGLPLHKAKVSRERPSSNYRWPART